MDILVDVNAYAIVVLDVRANSLDPSRKRGTGTHFILLARTRQRVQNEKKEVKVLSQ